MKISLVLAFRACLLALGRGRNRKGVSLVQNVISIRKINLEEIPAALELCWQVFLEFEAPEYSTEGVAAFRASLDAKERTRQLRF